MDGIGFRVYIGKCLQPRRKALHRIYGAAGKKEYDIQKAAEYAHYPRVIGSAEDNEHKPKEAEGRKDDNKNNHDRTINRERLPQIYTRNEGAEEQDKQGYKGCNDEPACSEAHDNVPLGKWGKEMAFVNSKEFIHDNIEYASCHGAEEYSHNHNPRDKSLVIIHFFIEFYLPQLGLRLFPDRHKLFFKIC